MRERGHDGEQVAPIKTCASCGATIDPPVLALGLPERCDDCADPSALVEAVEVLDPDAELPDAYLTVYPTQPRFGAFYESKEVASRISEKRGRIVRYVPAARATRSIERFSRAVASALEGAERNRAERDAARDAHCLCASSLVRDGDGFDCSLADGHEGEHRATDGTTWDRAARREAAAE